MSGNTSQSADGASPHVHVFARMRSAEPEPTSPRAHVRLIFAHVQSAPILPRAPMRSHPQPWSAPPPHLFHGPCPTASAFLRSSCLPCVWFQHTGAARAPPSSYGAVGCASRCAPLSLPPPLPRIATPSRRAWRNLAAPLARRSRRRRPQGVALGPARSLRDQVLTHKDLRAP